MQNGIMWLFIFVAVLHGLHMISDQFILQKLFFPAMSSQDRIPRFQLQKWSVLMQRDLPNPAEDQCGKHIFLFLFLVSNTSYFENINIVTKK